MPARQQLWIAVVTGVLLVASVWLSRPIGGLAAFIVVWTVYSVDRSIRIPAKLENREELMATILENTPASGSNA